MNSYKEIIKKLELAPHPEGGYFKETYRSQGKIEKEYLPDEYGSDRNYATCIYFLLTADTFSAFHKINQDEIWHFYDGSPIELHILSEDGNHSKVIIGNNFSKEHIPQYVVPGGCWFAAKVMDNEAYALVGCTVSPGFDFKDFVLPSRKELIAKFPEHQQLITNFTHH